jgi:hypothetical protein
LMLRLRWWKVFLSAESYDRYLGFFASLLLVKKKISCWVNSLSVDCSLLTQKLQTLLVRYSHMKKDFRSLEWSILS